MMGLTGDEKCLFFFQTLRGRAAEWFHNLPSGEIDSFDELGEVFQEKSKENCTKRKKLTYLSTAGPREHEDLTKFLTRWKDEVDKVEEMDDKTAMSLLVSRLRSGELYKEFCRRPPQSNQEAYNTAWDYANAEAQVSSKREAEQGPHRGRSAVKKEIDLPGRIKTEVLEVKSEKMERKPTGEKQWTEKYCSFHKTDTHNTAECKRQAADQNKKKKAAGKEHVKMIYGGPEGGDSASQRKKWGRELYVGSIVFDPRRKQTRREPITLTDQDLPSTGEDHNDPLVITMDMGGEVEKDEDRSRLEPGEETEEIVLREAFPEKMARIGRDLPEGLREEIISVLREYVDIFAWSVADMPGIDRSIICHRLAVIEVEVLTDQPLGPILRSSTSSGRMIKWAMILTKFKIDYKPRTAIKGQALTDFLVELTSLEPEARPSYTVEPWWDMAVDGASGPKGCRAGIVFTTPEGFKIFHALVFSFKLTNKEAEYEALAGRLRLARDSDTPVGNIDADMLSKLMQSCPEHVSKLEKIEILDLPSIDRLEVAAVQEDQSSPVGVIEAYECWRYDLMEYLMTGQKPDDEERARKVVLRAPWFQVLDGHLYKRTIGGPLLRCLTNPEAERVIAEVHEGVCTAHEMSRTLAQRILLLGYYWRPSSKIAREFPTFREAVYQPGQNEADHLAELNLVEERRTMDAVRMAGYQQSVKRYHDNRVGPRYFQVDDEVLRRRDASKPNERDKLVRIRDVVLIYVNLIAKGA
ncbi:unnamed protein product [Cuscuta campestris]|uniref:Retrotransposon gag domain-containing protein n=1 Tax=Cuscuta campestris TaxID=132261 RepID=A0A484ND42_9ASTE|nr:unnamed protein product [Cuscuta campestris]